MNKFEENLLLYKTKQKENINEKLGFFFNKYIKTNYFKCCLDTPLLQTTKIWIKNGIPKHLIHIPNPFYKNGKIKHINHFSITLNTYLKYVNLLDEKIDLIFADYCSSWNGNKTCNLKPSEDIKLLFNCRLLSKPSILALTVCRREGIRTTTTNKLFKLINNTIYKYAIKNKYKAHLLENQSYKKTMIVTVFYIC